jgi:hypothetical protein
VMQVGSCSAHNSATGVQQAYQGVSVAATGANTCVGCLDMHAVLFYTTTWPTQHTMRDGGWRAAAPG